MIKAVPSKQEKQLNKLIALTGAAVIALAFIGWGVWKRKGG